MTARTAPAARRTTTIRVATRGSAQARAQTEAIADRLRTEHPGLTVEFVVVETTGDLRTEVPLHQMGGQGVFVKEVQQAVLDGRADIAVHSAKDLPAAAAEGLAIGAFGTRRDPRDALIGRSLADLAPGARVASGSVRRRAQLAERRPDLEFVELRGNIATRLGRIPDGGAIVMAVTALEILGITERIAETLDLDWFVPMVGQGAVAVECRVDDRGTVEILGSIDDASTRRAVEIERGWLAAVGAGCSAPVGAFFADGQLRTYIQGPAATVRRVYHPAGIDEAAAAGRSDVAAAGW